MPKLSYTSGGVDLPVRTMYMTKDIVVQQSRGTSKADVMSQSSVTHELELHDTQIFDLTQEKLNKSEAEQIYLSKVLAEAMFAPLGDYAYKSDIPQINIDDYLLKSELPVKVSYFENDAEYLTKSALDGNYYDIPKINELLDNVKANSEALLFNYYDRDQVDELLKKSKENDSEIQENFDNRISALEQIDHSVYAEKSELDNYVTTENFDNEIANHYTKEETDKAIAEAITDENIGSLLSKEEASETYQPKGEYLTEHQPLDDYAKKDEVSAEIDTKVSEAVDGLNISDYLTINQADETYQPKGEYLTEHQPLDDYMTVTRAEEEHDVIDRNINELDERLKIAERLTANFQIFNDWKPGYYAPTDYALESLIQHDGCYYLVADVSNCRPDDFFAHYAPNSYNYYIFEYSDVPAKETYLKRTKKEQFDLVFNLDVKTKYIVAFAFTPIVSDQYYLRGIKITDSDNEHVTQAQFQTLVDKIESIDEYDDTEVKSRLQTLEQIDHNEFALKSELKEYDDTELKSRVSAIEADYLKSENIEGYATEEYVNQKIEEVDVTEQLIDYARKTEVTEEVEEAVSNLNIAQYETIVGAEEKYQPKGEYLVETDIENLATKDELNTKVAEAFNQIVADAPENFNTFKQVAEYVEEHKEVAKALQEAINDKADKTELVGLATEEYVDEKVGEIEIPEPYDDSELDNRVKSLESIDHSVYATKDSLNSVKEEVDNKVTEVDNKLTGLSGQLNSNSDKIQNIEKDYLKSENLNGLATEEYVNQKVEEVDITEQLKDYALKTEVAEEIGIAINSLSIENYLTKSEASQIYQPVGNYALKSELPEAYDDEALKSRLNALEAIDHEEFLKEEDIQGLATEQYVQQKVSEIEIPEEYNDEALKSDIAEIKSTYATKEFALAQKYDDTALNERISKVESQGYDDTELKNRVSELEAKPFDSYLTQHQSLEGYAKESYVQEEIQKIEIPEEYNDEALKADIEQIKSTYALKSEIPAPYNDEELKERVSELEAKPFDEYLTEHQSLAGLATQEYVDGKISEIEIPEEYNDEQIKSEIAEIKSDYALKSEVPAPYNDSELKNRVSELEAKPFDSYLTQHQSLEGYAKESYVQSEIKKIEIPEEYNDEELRNRIGTLEEEVASIEDYDDSALKSEIAEIKSDYATKSELNTKVTEKFNEIVADAPSNFNTFKQVAEYVEEHKEVAKALQEAINDKADKTELVGLATETYVNGKIDNLSSVYQPIGNYALKSDLIGLASESFVEGKIAEIPEYDDTLLQSKISELSSDLSEVNDELGYYDEKEISFEYDIHNTIPNGDSFITQSGTSTIYRSFRFPTEGYKYVLVVTDSYSIPYTIIQSLSPNGIYTSQIGSLEENYIPNTLYPLNETTKYICIGNVNPNTSVKCYLISCGGIRGEISNIRREIPTDYLTENALKGYATETFVTQKINAIEGYNDSELRSLIDGKADKSALNDYQLKGNYALKSELYNDVELKSRIEILERKEDYDDTELDRRIKALESKPFDSYLTQHQSLEGYATETYVTDKIESLSTVYQPVGDYALKSEIPSLEDYMTKAEAGAAHSALYLEISRYETEADGKFATKEEINSMYGNVDEILNEILGE